MIIIRCNTAYGTLNMLCVINNTGHMIQSDLMMSLQIHYITSRHVTAKCRASTASSLKSDLHVVEVGAPEKTFVHIEGPPTADRGMSITHLVSRARVGVGRGVHVDVSLDCAGWYPAAARLS